MKKNILIASFLTVLMCTSAQAAILAGDTIRVGHNYPALGNEVVNPVEYTVVNGNSDAHQIHNVYSVDVDDTSIYVDYNQTASWINNVAFNGLVISKIDTVLSDFSFDTNLTGWSLSRFYFDDSTLRFDWQGLAFTADSYFDVSFNSASAVPIPAAAFMLAPALLGFMGLRRRAKSNAA